VIHLPWKNDTVEAGDQIIHEGNLNELLNKDIGTEDCKASSSNAGECSIINRTRIEVDLKEMTEINEKQESNKEHCKVPSKSSQFQRNCPKNK
jgi:hypothetical protein